MVKRLLIAFVVLLAAVSSADAQGPIFIVRHAERADAGGPSTTDPNLSRVGHARAKSLATMLKDTKLTAIFATEFKRTQQTAAPTAQAKKLTVSTVPAAKTAALVEQLQGAAGAVLVVGHSNTVSEIITALGVKTPVKVEETEFDNFFIVTTEPQPRLIRLRYK